MCFRVLKHIKRAGRCFSISEKVAEKLITETKNSPNREKNFESAASNGEC